jgi:crotonobetaine/carnitine-CoA ligase
MKTVQLIGKLSQGAIILLWDEFRRGTLRDTLRLTREKGRLTVAHDVSHAGLLEEKAAKHGDRPFLNYYGRSFTYAEMDANANRVARYLQGLGAGPGKAIAIMMKNSPRWLDVFFGAQKLGMCAVPVNIALRGNQLSHIFNNSGSTYACIDYDLLPFYENIKDKLQNPPVTVVNPPSDGKGFRADDAYVSMDEAYGRGAGTGKPAVVPREGDPCLLLYTSGTTGLPKGVPTHYGRTSIRMMNLLSRTLLNRNDVYFTCLPLFHANAILLTVTSAMNVGAQVALREKFSASRFWDEVRETGATIFNTIGGIIPILMKQPEKPGDRNHSVKQVLSAACPADMWEKFENRFGVKIIEGYGAVDGGGVVVMNYGQAPAGSMGKPLGSKYRIVDGDNKDVPSGQSGELIFFTGKKTNKAVEYYKDEKATSSKLRDGWLYTGDMVYADKKGYLYFVGRKTESLRRRGENISAYEVEHAILQHPKIVECAAYAVPSELGEDEVMTAIVPVAGTAIDVKELREFLKDHLAKFAIPRYFRIMPELPKTETQRVIKGILSKEGITADTMDMEKMQS